MCRFIESICCVNGQLQNLSLHQDRVNRTFDEFFDRTPFTLTDHIKNAPNTGKYKCRVVYSDTQVEVEFTPYSSKTIKSLQVVDGGLIDYPFKREDRSELDSLFNQKKNCDDIIIIKEGMVTDSYYANLAFYDERSWVTSKTPLLKGVRRQRLIDESIIEEKEITKDALRSYSQVSLINAMLDLGEVVISMKNVAYS